MEIFPFGEIAIPTMIASVVIVAAFATAALIYLVMVFAATQHKGAWSNAATLGWGFPADTQRSTPARKP